MDQIQVYTPQLLKGYWILFGSIIIILTLAESLQQNSPVLVKEIEKDKTYTVTIETAHRANIDEEMSYMYLIDETNGNNQWLSEI